MRVNASSAPWRMVAELKSKAWGSVLDVAWRSVTSVLEVLARQADAKTGRVIATVPQLADQARYSTRQVRRALTVLTVLGLVEWERGGIASGRPTPSTFTVVKAQLYGLVDPARARMVDLLERRAQANQVRQTQYGLRWTIRRPPRAVKRLVSPCGHGVTPSLPTEVDGRPPDPPPPDSYSVPARRTTVAAFAAAARANIRRTRTTNAGKRAG